MTFISVLLPAPFSPMSACTSPSRNSRSTPSSATVGPNDLEIRESLSAIIITSQRVRRIVSRISFQSIVEWLGGLHRRAFVRRCDRHDADVVVVRQRQRRCVRGYVERVGKKVRIRRSLIPSVGGVSRRGELRDG